MRTTLLTWTAVAFISASLVRADEPGPAGSAVHPAAGVWYGMYRNYVDISPRAARSEPVFVVMILALRDEAVTGTITAGRGIRYEDPQAAMKRLLEMPLVEARPPPTRILEGTIEGAQLALTVLPPLGVAEPIVDIAAEVDGDRMRASLQVAADDVRIVRLDRCNATAGAAVDDTAAAAPVSNEGRCSVEAIWRRLSQEYGVAVDPNGSRSRRR